MKLTELFEGNLDVYNCCYLNPYFSVPGSEPSSDVSLIFYTDKILHENFLPYSRCSPVPCHHWNASGFISHDFWGIANYDSSIILSTHEPLQKNYCSYVSIKFQGGLMIVTFRLVMLGNRAKWMYVSVFRMSAEYSYKRRIFHVQNIEKTQCRVTWGWVSSVCSWL